MDRGTWQATVHGVAKSQTQLSDFTSLLHFTSWGFPGDSGDKESACNVVRFLGREDLLEKGIATLSSILAWRTPWTEEPGGQQPMESQRVGQSE